MLARQVETIGENSSVQIIQMRVCHLYIGFKRIVTAVVIILLFRCVPGSYTMPTGTVRVDFESPPNEGRVTTDVPPSIIDSSIKVVKLDRSTVSMS
jgi:hypothetical protein